MRFLFITILLNIFIISGQAEIQFNHYTIRNGLSENSITSVCQDKKGFMWFGTRNSGINRFDGINFTTYNLTIDASTQLCSNEITFLEPDTLQQLIWIGTTDGLNCLNQKTDNIDIAYYTDQDNILFSFSGKKITDIIADENGTVWVVASNHLYCKSKDDVYFKAIPFRIGDIRSIAKMGKDNLIVASFTQIYLYSISSQILQELNIFKDIPKGEIYNVHVDKDQNIFVGFVHNGFALYSSTDYASYYFSPQNTPVMRNGFIRCFSEDENGIVYIGGFNGLYTLDKSTLKVNAYFSDDRSKYGLSHNSIVDIYKDMAGNMWFGTYSGGVNVKYQTNYPFQTYYHDPSKKNTITSNVINTFFEDQHGIWIGTDGAGISLFNNGEFKNYTLPLDNHKFATHIKVISKRDENTLWLGGHNSGLLVFNVRTNAIEHRYMGNKGIYDIAKDTTGLLWLATVTEGLICFDEAKNSVTNNINIPKHFKSPLKNLHYSSSTNTMWVCTQDGVYFYNYRSKQFIKLKNHYYWSHHNNTIHHFFEDKQHNIWLATSQGLYRIYQIDYQSGNCKTQIFNTSNILPSNTIMAVAQDDSGLIWVSSLKGITRISLDYHTARTFNHDYNIQGNEFSPTASYKSKDHRLWFGGNEGFSAFDPAMLKSNQYIPPVAFTQLTINNMEISPNHKYKVLTSNISYTKKLKLNYWQNNIILKVAALNFNKPERNNYKWELYNHDREILTGNTSGIHINNLLPGNYELKVWASNNDNVWNNTPLVLKIEIIPQWYKTNIAIIVFILLGLLMLIAILKVISDRKKVFYNLKLEKQEKELQEKKIMFFTNISHEIRTPLSLIYGPLTTAIELAQSPELKKQLKLAKRNTTRLMTLINQLIDIRRVEQNHKQLKVGKYNLISLTTEIVDLFKESFAQSTITLNNTSTNVEGFVDSDILEKVISNLLTNAIKYNKENNPISVSISDDFCTDHSLLSSSTVVGEAIDPNIRCIVISVEDQGIGIPQKDLSNIFGRFFQIERKDHQTRGYGIGLSYIHKLIAIHKGQIKVETKEYVGSRFSIKLPVEKSYYEDSEIAAVLVDDEKPLRYFDEEDVLYDNTGEQLSQTNTTILIVEDNLDLRNWMVNYLSRYFNCIEADNGRAGIELAKKKIPDIIISDIMMPEVDGLELCRTLKNDQLTSHVPIILLTAKSAETDEKLGVESGADLYISKPFDVQMLLSRINNLLKLKQQIIKRFNLNPDDKSFEESLSIHDRRIKNKIDQYISANLSDVNLNVETMAREIGMSRVSLYRKLKALTGISPNQYIRDVRLSNAAKLIKKQQFDILEVSEKVGFADVYYFRKCFEKKFGIKPEKM
ncbi:Signal transduction histidine kinase [Mariniphaga anaerophila]|uniref:histidine kinase n=1 Tax=Mariniphaga anaerophila TaxID=1484053 RepID=A0A1M4SW08_9BACT|nr:two-component regulator propeller domain-containing protein [Mariniphaga anaerophila]SHE36372.1 Signal transduction histidine kinase [Mariniphaga anaerophila]